MAVPGFWGAQSKANTTIQELKRLKSTLEPWRAAWAELETLQELSSLIDAGDTSSQADLQKSLSVLARETVIVGMPPGIRR